MDCGYWYVPCIGKWLIRTNLATELIVGALFVSFIQSTVAIAIMIPVPRKRASVMMKVVVTPEGILEVGCCSCSSFTPPLYRCPVRMYIGVPDMCALAAEKLNPFLPRTPCALSFSKQKPQNPG